MRYGSFVKVSPEPKWLEFNGQWLAVVFIGRQVRILKTISPEEYFKLKLEGKEEEFLLELYHETF